MNIKVKTSLRVILIGVTVLPLLLLMLVAGLNIFSFAKNTIASETGIAGYAHSAGVVNILEGYLGDVRALSAVPAVDVAVSDLNSVKSEITGIRNSYKANRVNILDVVITDNEGFIITDGIDSAAGTRFFAYSDEWSSRQGAFVSDIYTANAEYGKDIFVTTAVTSGDSKGYVSCVVDLSEITTYIAGCSYLDYGALVISDGTKLIGSGGTADVSASGLSDALKNKIPTINTESFDSNYKEINDSNYLGAYGKVSGSDWVWVSLFATSRANEAVLPVFLVGLVILIALALICVLINEGHQRR